MSQLAKLDRAVRPWARKIPLAQAVYRALSSGHAILSGAPAFAPNSAGSTKLRAAITLQAAQQTFEFLTKFLEVTGRELAAPVAVEQFVSDQEGRTAASSLKVLFDRYGSDKATEHDYHLIYGQILARPGDVHAMLEVGLGTDNEDVPSHMGSGGKPGASLRAFRDYLPDAQVFGADIDTRILFTEERIRTSFVDQTDLRTIEALADQLPDLDLVIDDGLHSPNANIAILILAMSKLKPGGWVVIEDIHPRALPVWQVIASLMPAGYRCSLIDARNGMVFAARRTP